MSSKERHENRFRRRKAARERKKAARAAEIANIEKSMSFGKMLKWGWACCSGTSWKSSTQSFRLGIIASTARQHKSVMQGKINSKGFICFDRMERGKLRHIKSVHITERQIRKTKREAVGYEAAGLDDDFTAASIKLNRQKQEYRKFAKASKIRPKWERTQELGFNRFVSGKAASHYRKRKRNNG